MKDAYAEFREKVASASDEATWRIIARIYLLLLDAFLVGLLAGGLVAWWALRGR